MEKIMTRLMAPQTDLLMSRPDGDADLIMEHAICGTVNAPRLTSREMEILQLVISGKTNKEIAQELCRVERTVEYHRNHLMHKLNAHNVSELFKKAISIGVKPL
jgi:DNA-binding NarL/FixJ family response regulator